MVLALFLAVVGRWAVQVGISPIIPGVIAGGSLANALDRAEFGAVRDFLHTPWLVIDIGDIAIVAGIIALGIRARVACVPTPRRRRRRSRSTCERCARRSCPRGRADESTRPRALTCGFRTRQLVALARVGDLVTGVTVGSNGTNAWTVVLLACTESVCTRSARSVGASRRSAGDRQRRVRCRVEAELDRVGEDRAEGHGLRVGVLLDVLVRRVDATVHVDVRDVVVRVDLEDLTVVGAARTGRVRREPRGSARSAERLGPTGPGRPPTPAPPSRVNSSTFTVWTSQPRGLRRG